MEEIKGPGVPYLKDKRAWIQPKPSWQQMKLGQRKSRNYDKLFELTDYRAFETVSIVNW